MEIAVTDDSKPMKFPIVFIITNTRIASGLFGYFLWNIDFHLCFYVTSVKRYVGLPWGLLLELHGWWHIFTGIGAYVGMALTEYLVTIEDGKTDKIEEGFVWPVRAVLHDLEGTKTPNGVAGKKER
jgi:dihydroceramidase